MNLKIREAQLQKIPYMLIVGDEEIGSSTVSVRLRSGKTLKAQPLPQFKDRIKAEVETKTEVV
jgi:threonyl-tRNA synthetase